MRPFRNLLWLSAADFLARTLNFITFVYLARVLGVESYGVLEFAISVMAYLVLLADAGLDIWGTRQTARGDPVVLLVSKVLPLRLIFASLALVVLFILLPFLPDYPGLDATLIVLGLVWIRTTNSL